MEFELGSGWGPLCEFLGKDVPDTPFPWINETAALHEKIGIISRRGLGRALRRWAMYGTGLVGVVVALWVYKG